MSKEKPASSSQKTTISVTQVSRREFLKEAGKMAGGAAVASVVLSSCNSSGNSTAKTPQTSAPSPVTTTSKVPPASSFAYIPQLTYPPVIIIPGGTSEVATDRLYSLEHIWVKSLGEKNMVVMGISDKLQLLLNHVAKLELPEAGATTKYGESFGYAEGFKMNTALISPVTGTVIERNEFLITMQKQGAWVGPVEEDPYVGGWMIVVRLGKPEELNELMTAEEYAQLQSKAIE
jgi:glycine cleavage system H protein